MNSETEISLPDAVERLRTAVKDAGGATIVASRANVPLGTLNNYLRSVSEPKVVALAALARACGVSLDWLMFGGAPATTPANASAPSPELQGLIWVPRYEVAASAGNGDPVFDEPRATVWPVPRELLRGLARDPKTLEWLDVAGDSMAPTLVDGDPIIIDRSATTVDREAVYVLTVGTDLFVKRVRRWIDHRGRVCLVLASDNAAYPDITIGVDSQEMVAVIGRVVWPNTARR